MNLKFQTANCKKWSFSVHTKIGLYGIIMSMFFLLACCKEKNSIPESGNYIITQIKKCGRLHVVEYQIHKLVIFDDPIRIKGRILSDSFNIRLPLGDRKIIIPIDVILSAYIDFDYFTNKNITFKDQQIIITLPDPQITVKSSKIDHNSVRQYIDFSRSRFSDSEMAKLCQQGEEIILSHLNSYDILKKARISAAHTLIPIISNLGYKEESIVIQFQNNTYTDNVQRFIEKKASFKP